MLVGLNGLMSITVVQNLVHITEERLAECVCVISGHWGTQAMSFAPVSEPEQNIQETLRN